VSVLVIKNLPPELHERLKRRAAQNHRSLTKEAIAVLEAGTQGQVAPAINALDQVAAAGEALLAQGIDLEDWAARSRDVWR
jgi:plasmid stability protein